MSMSQELLSQNTTQPNTPDLLMHRKTVSKNIGIFFIYVFNLFKKILFDIIDQIYSRLSIFSLTWQLKGHKKQTKYLHHVGLNLLH